MHSTFLSVAGISCVLVTTAACGSSPSGPSGQPQPVTETVTGSTRQTGPNSCTSDSHDFMAADGEIRVTLLETSDPAGALAVQICAGGIDNNNCTINVTRITAGQTLTSSRRGTANQNLKFLAHNCVFGGPVLSQAMTYRASVTYQR